VNGKWLIYHVETVRTLSSLTINIQNLKPDQSDELPALD
jgi:hypothetical protein